MSNTSKYLGCVAVLLAICACGINQPLGTQVAPVVHSQVASFDGGEQNSGILAFDKATATFHVTAHFHERWLALAEKYGKQFTPPLDVTRGVTPLPDGSFSFDPEALTDFLRMNRWRRQTTPAVATPAPSLMHKLIGAFREQEWKPVDEDGEWFYLEEPSFDPHQFFFV